MLYIVCCHEACHIYNLHVFCPPRAGPTAAILNSNKMEAPLISQATTPLDVSTPRPIAPQGPAFNSAKEPSMPQAVPNSNGGLAALTGELLYCCWLTVYIIHKLHVSGIAQIHVHTAYLWLVLFESV